VLDWSYANGFRTSEEPMRSIPKGLPRQPRKSGHFAALPHAEVPAFMKRVRARGISGSRLALERANGRSKLVEHHQVEARELSR